ncbi:MAG: hypothetical protein HOQ11_12745 [Gemmatimonadaceae bacterium]|nr:hypothetical protein [Gemmatimonadaceae bacterium]NUR18527.1 hypothetical protein [Gemmatimonadaceae bacterium]NUS98265.1 hypothetical protein [Gemmatimonadaceae bacterium]
MARRILLALLLAAAPLAAQQPSRATRPVYVDATGTIRWRDTKEEVRLFGANYTLPSASDYRAPGYLGLDRKKLVDEDMAQFARMGWNALRISFWGDWENSDHAGNLIANDHLDLADYVIARARERGIYILLSPITTYQSTWPDASGDTTPPGFANFYRKSELGTNPAAIAAQTNYIRQILHHVNPYTGIAWEDEPAIIFIEPINEPTHHSADVPGSVAYIDSLVAAVRSTRSRAITFHNVSQDFAIAESIRRSTVQGVTFGWYPTGLNSGHELRGSYLRTVDDYPPMRDPRIATLPRIVYEFDAPDTRTGYMYPAMARAMRSVGAQFAAMFAYDMLGTASRNLGWQTHYLNLVYTPRKAMSAVIAAEAMRRLPKGRSYGGYPANTRFGDFRVSDVENSAVLAAEDAYINAGATEDVKPPRPGQLTRVAGYLSSPVVHYDGEGAYFLDRLRPGVWRLEVYPDAVPVRDPFEPMAPEKVVTRAIFRAHRMRIALPDLGESFTVRVVAARGEDGSAGRRGEDSSEETRADAGVVTVRPGVYILSRSGSVDPRTLPATLGALRIDEYHAPPRDTVPLTVVPLAASEFDRGAVIDIGARVVDTIAPDSVVLSIRRLDQGWFRRFPMHAVSAYEYRAWLPPDTIGSGPFEYAITVVRGDSATTFPGRVRERPGDWNFDARELWRGAVVSPNAPLRLFTARDDVRSLSFSRIGDGYREGVYRVVSSAADGEPVLQFGLPRIDGRGPADYTASLVIADRIASRGAPVDGARKLRVRLRGLNGSDRVQLTLVERDGTSWGTELRADSAWSERSIPIAELRPVRSVKLPEGYPGDWNYWLDAPPGRGGAGDAIRLHEVERLQLSVRQDGGALPRVEIEWVGLDFGAARPRDVEGKSPH